MGPITPLFFTEALLDVNAEQHNTGLADTNAKHVVIQNTAADVGKGYFRDMQSRRSDHQVALTHQSLRVFQPRSDNHDDSMLTCVQSYSRIQHIYP